MSYNLYVIAPGTHRFSWPISTAEAFVDHLRLKVDNYGDDKPRVTVRVNVEDASKIPAGATLLTVGGPDCPKDVGFCMREYGGYEIRLVHRLFEQPGGVKLRVTEPLGISYDVYVYEGKNSYTPDHGLLIGGFFDRGHIMRGGYSLIYVQKV